MSDLNFYGKGGGWRGGSSKRCLKRGGGFIEILKQGVKAKVVHRGKRF